MNKHDLAISAKCLVDLLTHRDVHSVHSSGSVCVVLCVVRVGCGAMFLCFVLLCCCVCVFVCVHSSGSVCDWNPHVSWLTAALQDVNLALSLPYHNVKAK